MNAVETLSPFKETRLFNTHVTNIIISNDVKLPYWVKLFSTKKKHTPTRNCMLETKPTKQNKSKAANAQKHQNLNKINAFQLPRKGKKCYFSFDFEHFPACTMYMQYAYAREQSFFYHRNAWINNFSISCFIASKLIPDLLNSLARLVNWKPLNMDTCVRFFSFYSVFFFAKWSENRFNARAPRIKKRTRTI